MLLYWVFICPHINRTNFPLYNQYCNSELAQQQFGLPWNLHTYLHRGNASYLRRRPCTSCFLENFQRQVCEVRPQSKVVAFAPKILICSEVCDIFQSRKVILQSTSTPSWLVLKQEEWSALSICFLPST